MRSFLRAALINVWPLFVVPVVSFALFVLVALAIGGACELTMCATRAVGVGLQLAGEMLLYLVGNGG